MIVQIELEDYLRSLGDPEKKSINITDYIPTGRENAIPRSDLARKVGVSDRKVRDLIHCARREVPILNMQDGKGYFKPDMNDETEVNLLRAYYNQENARLKSIGWSLLSARKALKEHDIQINDTRKTG